MGPTLRGASPPFSPTGRAALASSIDLGGELGKELVQAGHLGILARFRVDWDKAASLIPKPLEPVEHTDIVGLFVNQTQSGVNLYREAGSGELDLGVSPHHINWHESFFKIPCAYKGEKCVMFSVMYKDVDHSLSLGIYDGFVTKLATFREKYPTPGNPLNDAMRPGASAHIHLSRNGDKVMNLDFVAEREVPEEELSTIIDIVEWWRVCGIRHFPDYTNPGGPPLVHDLVMWRMANGAITKAWGGRADIQMGTSDYEELDLLQPVEQLESYFVHYQYQAGPGVCEVLHDYTVEPLA
jgi:hypothetical protein